MNPFEKNPFHEAYVTDTVPNDQFVDYFSPFLIPHAPEVFLPGNVIVKGSQGCGKSMLLRLLEPKIRLAYYDKQKAAGTRTDKFPVPNESRSFIAARVNLSKSGLLDITQTQSSKASLEEKRSLAITFGDYFNYWMLRDLLESVALAAKRSDAFDSLVSPERLDDFAAIFSQQDCLFGFMDGIVRFDDLRSAVSNRIIGYRKWTNGNARLPSNTVETRTAIGEPLSRAAVCLKESGALKPATNVFLTIDQLEAFWTNDPESVSSLLRREVHELLGRRDGRVSYRLGARRYNWTSGSLQMRDGRELEDGRDFLTTDVDLLLRRKEVGKWPFIAFATDVYRRRLTGAFGQSDDSHINQLFDPKHYFGPSLEGAEWLESLVTNPPADPANLLLLDEQWPQKWREAISDCYNKKLSNFKSLSTQTYPKDPIAAVLMAAWGLQRGGRSGDPERRTKESPPTSSEKPPWTKPWWKKERMPQVFLQIAGRHSQRLYWSGWEHVLSLSGSNILFFVRICREVWDMWRRLNQTDEFNFVTESDCVVPRSSQFLALHNVSLKMHELFEAQPGRPAGNVRMRFIDQLGSWMRSKLMDDKQLSYPGHNGFSLTRSELESSPDLRALIEEAVGWGDLYEVRHTSKSKKETTSNPRKKYYLNPILSPYYQLPHAHTKEPIYNALEELRWFARRAHLLSGPAMPPSLPQPVGQATSRQPDLPLFDSK